VHTEPSGEPSIEPSLNQKRVLAGKVVVDLYHHYLPTLAKVQKLTPARSRSITARFQELRNDDETMDDFWRRVFYRAGQSSFLTGRSANQRSWKPTLDFFLQPSSCVKVLEGAYDDPAGKTAAVPAKIWDDKAERWVDTAGLKPWDLERLQRANQSRESFEHGAVNA
jgi:hypothetical protein